MTHPDIGYWIGTETGCNYTNIYVSWAALGNPSQVCLIWGTDINNPKLD
ncbi:MAG: hypothetical protein IMY83_03435 [Chloroflexi bacterium]|jgi:hypothetical protein|nr:hypothetical protein [Chloroflexota bacterium]